MSERDLQENVRRYCAALRLFHYHPHDSRRSEPGWPDSVILGGKGILWRELKSETGRLTAAQREVGGILTRLGQDWAVWRPRDLTSGRIIRELQAIR